MNRNKRRTHHAIPKGTPLLLAGLASFALVRYNFKGRNYLMSVVVASMMFPAFSTIVPVFRMEDSRGLVNNSNRWISLLSCALPQIAGRRGRRRR